MSLMPRTEVTIVGGRNHGRSAVVESVGTWGPVLVGGRAFFDSADVVHVWGPRFQLRATRWRYEPAAGELRRLDQ